MRSLVILTEEDIAKLMHDASYHVRRVLSDGSGSPWDDDSKR